MKTIDRIFICLISITITTAIFVGNKTILNKIQKVNIEKQFVPLTDFELIKLAIIWQETKGNPYPKYSDGDSEGLYQITKIYVDEVNRILGYNKYTYADRKNPLKSREMFLVVQNYHNPKKDVKKAIKLHNKAGWYFEEVMDRYNCLKLYNEILIFKNK